MGVKYIREYEEIIQELTDALYKIENFYEFFDMTAEDWIDIPESERKECALTLADDLFYALGNDPEITIGDGIIKHDKSKNIIVVSYEGNNINITL
jgi:hypothetical protein